MRNQPASDRLGRALRNAGGRVVCLLITGNAGYTREIGGGFAWPPYIGTAAVIASLVRACLTGQMFDPVCIGTTTPMASTLQNTAKLPMSKTEIHPCRQVLEIGFSENCRCSLPIFRSLCRSARSARQLALSRSPEVSCWATSRRRSAIASLAFASIRSATDYRAGREFQVLNPVNYRVCRFVRLFGHRMVRRR